MINDQNLRIGIFVLLLILFSSLEFFIPYRKRELRRGDRWFANLTLILISNITLKFLFPASLIVMSVYFKDQGQGIFNQLELNPVLVFVLSLIILDFAIYVQHVIFHKVDFFWKFHRVHHADTDLDATSGLRFHPIEIVFSIIYKLGIVFIFGLPGISIFYFEIILSSCALFNHSNIDIPQRFEKVLRLFLVTPQMHIIHHSIKKVESDTNYGFNLSIWDRLFKTYQEKFKSEGIIGQSYYRSKKEHGLLAILLLPFKETTRGE